MAKYKYGICEWAMPGNGQYGCAVAHNAGLQGIQLNLGDVNRGWHLSHPEMQKIYLDEAQRWEIEYPSMAVNSLCDVGMTRKEGTKERELARYSIKLGVDTAVSMKIPILMLPTFHDSYIKDKEDYELVLKAVKEACEYAYDRNITIALENVFSTDEFMDFVNKVGTGNLKIIYDSQNYSVCKNYDNTQIYEEIKDYVVAMHIKDGFDVMSTHMLGEGGSNFYKTAEAVKKSGYSGWIYAENYFDQDRLGEIRKPYELLKKDVEVLKAAFES
ncbi:MAG: sugar phosphate isomerase/epimerase [Eubacteriales bacterium]|nr:sugar phosphate isomerase/epimerase [Eubacteriales bacterium]